MASCSGKTGLHMDPSCFAAKADHVSPRRWSWLPYPENQVGPPAERFAGLTTHMQLWPASVAFAKWLEARQGALGLTKPSVRILELGAGIGWLGHMLATNLGPSAEIVLTDRADCVEAMKADMHDAGRVRMEAMEWEDFDVGSKPGETALPPRPSSASAFNLVIGADLAWSTSTAENLPCAIHALLAHADSVGARTTVLYAHWFRSQKSFKVFCSTCETLGLFVQDCTDTVVEDEVAVTADLVLETEDTDVGESDDDHDCFSLIFDGASDAEDRIFKVYRISLKQ
eukprot:TRINITY_DN18113_c0_g1_i2.p1 TRINITY_DN18113_c0_g1~~TRINITY_DN18113_c0_g1_i2.p1  ORF type:complete len:300 (-),score=54.19 TRINITY_DN18113_c0_g1_i2:206-1060(-)